MEKGMKRGFCIIVFWAVLFLINTGHAELFNRGSDSLGNQLIYDDDLNITWYDYSNSPDTWYNQMDWAAALTVNFNSTVYDNWRLPSSVYAPWPEQAGYNITSSEMGHLFYNRT
ncbi:MAG: hypothetical protein C4526_03015 [Nitrospiraceae bacterium]|nr:MAG: hypothetical protein C4526_03015 [Nitrospiraceae bacterium]